jgi:ABC-type polar amino acid transport system ATPase subunit
MTEELIRLSDYTLKALSTGSALRDFNLVFSKGEAFSIVTDSPDDAHHLLRGIATLEPPQSGRFFYKGEAVDFSDYRNLLPYKRKIGYIASDATLVTNRSLRDNLMLMRYYFENSISIEMSETLGRLCTLFGLDKRLDLKPHQLDPEEHRVSVIVRELSKGPEILLVERPRVFLRTKYFEALKDILRDLMKKDLALVFSETDKAFTNEFANKIIAIHQGKVTSFSSDSKHVQRKGASADREGRV